MTEPTPPTDTPPVATGLGQHMKAINSTIILVLGVFVTGLGDGSMSNIEYIMAGIALLRGILLVGVQPQWGKIGVYLPLVITAAIGALTQLVTALSDGGGISSSEIVSVLVVFFTALSSTAFTSNAAVSDKLRSYYRRAA